VVYKGIVCPKSRERLQNIMKKYMIERMWAHFKRGKHNMSQGMGAMNPENYLDAFSRMSE